MDGIMKRTDTVQGNGTDKNNREGVRARTSGALHDTDSLPTIQPTVPRARSEVSLRKHIKNMFPVLRTFHK